MQAFVSTESRTSLGAIVVWELLNSGEGSVTRVPKWALNVDKQDIMVRQLGGSPILRRFWWSHF